MGAGRMVLQYVKVKLRLGSVASSILIYSELNDSFELDADFLLLKDK